jgi:hypothetical protein
MSKHLKLYAKMAASEEGFGEYVEEVCG